MSSSGQKCPIDTSIYNIYINKYNFNNGKYNYINTTRERARNNSLKEIYGGKRCFKTEQSLNVYLDIIYYIIHIGHAEKVLKNTQKR